MSPCFVWFFGLILIIIFGLIIMYFIVDLVERYKEKKEDMNDKDEDYDVLGFVYELEE